MNWLKNLITPDQWKTIFQREIEVNPSYLHLSRNQWKFLIVKVEEKKNKHLAYLTDGVNKSEVDLNLITMAYPEIVDILKEHNIIW